MLKDEKFKDILNTLYDGVYVCDTDRRVNFWNQAAERITGFSRDEVIGHFCRDNILMHVDENGRSLCKTMCPMAATIKDGLPRTAEVFLHHKDGHRVPVAIRVTPIKENGGEVVGVVEVFSDGTPNIEFKRRLETLEKLALIDSLTGLPNRRYMEDNILSRQAELDRLGWSFGLLFMDIDHFKHVNDNYGHQLGDMVLQTVSRTLERNTRPYDVVGRWGGEEFLAVVVNVDPEGLWAVAERFRALVKRSTVSGPQGPVSVTISIGASMAEKDDTLETLVKRADANMYQSKKQGRDRVSLG